MKSQGRCGSARERAGKRKRATQRQQEQQKEQQKEQQQQQALGWESAPQAVAGLGVELVLGLLGGLSCAGSNQPEEGVSGGALPRAVSSGRPLARAVSETRQRSGGLWR